MTEVESIPREQATATNTDQSITLMAVLLKRIASEVVRCEQVGAVATTKEKL